MTSNIFPPNEPPTTIKFPKHKVLGAKGSFNTTIEGRSLKPKAFGAKLDVPAPGGTLTFGGKVDASSGKPKEVGIGYSVGASNVGVRRPQMTPPPMVQPWMRGPQGRSPTQPPTPPPWQRPQPRSWTERNILQPGATAGTARVPSSAAPKPPPGWTPPRNLPVKNPKTAVDYAMNIKTTTLSAAGHIAKHRPQPSFRLKPPNAYQLKVPPPSFRLGTPQPSVRLHTPRPPPARR